MHKKWFCFYFLKSSPFSLLIDLDQLVKTLQKNWWAGESPISPDTVTTADLPTCTHFDLKVRWYDLSFYTTQKPGDSSVHDQYSNPAKEFDQSERWVHFPKQQEGMIDKCVQPINKKRLQIDSNTKSRSTPPSTPAVSVTEFSSEDSTLTHC